MEHVLIIADDLTGACDTGIKFQNLGMKTRVLTKPDFTAGCFEQWDSVLSVNTATRCMTGEQARKQIATLLSSLTRNDSFFCYKKIDSVLRGNIMDEVEAVFDVMHPEFAVVTPAFPENGRCVRNAVLHIRGGRGCEEQVNALELLQAQTQRKCGCITHEIIAQGTDAVVQAIREQLGSGKTVLLADSWDRQELDVIADAVLQFGSRCLPVGSAGLAQSLALKMAAGYCGGPDEENACAGYPLIVVGTRHPVTLRQLQRLTESAKLKTYILPVDDIRQNDPDTVIRKMLEHPLNPKDYEGILLTTDGIFSGEESDRVSLLRHDHNTLILDLIGRGIEAIVRCSSICGIIATGGDVALEVLDRLDLRWIDLVAEPIPGIVTGKAQGSGNPILLTTKSGGFGDENALAEMFCYIASQTNNCT